MTVFPDWEKYAVPQKRSATGCIPTGYEMLLRVADIKGIDFDTFQDEFDLEYLKIGKNNFETVANKIKEKYPQVSISIKHFKTGSDKLKFIEELLTKKQPVLISLAIRPEGGWHIMPVVDADENSLLLLWSIDSNGNKKLMRILKSEFVRRHDEWPGGDDIAFVDMKPVVNITYFVHGTTTDNEKGIATGWSPGELSELGKKQSIELKELIKDKKFDVVSCSDLKRAVDSAKLTFGDSVKIIQDKRLREVNYGDLTKADSKIVESLTLEHINKPFPNGESYKDVEKRIKSFLNDLLKNYAGKNVAIIAHKAPQLALDILLKGKTWEQAVKEDWRLKQPKEWKPGWEYILKVKID